jgi:hypothetical protein
MSLHVAYIILVLPLHAFRLCHLLIQTLLGLMVLLLDIHGCPMMALGLLGVLYSHRNSLAAE